MNNWVLTAIFIVAVLAIGWIIEHRKERKENAALDAQYKAQEEADLEREGRHALLVRDRCRYARNFAADMRDERVPAEERKRNRNLYEEAKSKAFVELLTIKDDFYRAVATHGVIDLLLAGQEVERARGLFASLDDTLQDSIVSTGPERYSLLREG